MKNINQVISELKQEHNIGDTAWWPKWNALMDAMTYKQFCRYSTGSDGVLMGDRRHLIPQRLRAAWDEMETCRLRAICLKKIEDKYW